MCGLSQLVSLKPMVTHGSEMLGGGGYLEDSTIIIKNQNTTFIFNFRYD